MVGVFSFIQCNLISRCSGVTYQTLPCVVSFITPWSAPFVVSRVSLRSVPFVVPCITPLDVPYVAPCGKAYAVRLQCGCTEECTSFVKIVQTFIFDIVDSFSCIFDFLILQIFVIKNAKLYDGKAKREIFFNIHFTRAYKQLYSMSVSTSFVLLQRTVKNISIIIFCIKDDHFLSNKMRHLPSECVHIFIFLFILHKYPIFLSKDLKFCAYCSIIYSACIAFYIILFILTI